MLELSLKIILFFVLIIILGIKSSIDDLKDKKIYNKTILIFLGLGLILNFTNSFYEFRVNYLVNLSFAFFIGFFLWYVNFWNAGDGKLFLAYVSLIPVELVFIDKTTLYSYNLITYTFVPIFFVFCIFLIFQATKKEFISSIKESFKPKIILNLALAFFSFQWVIELVNQSFGLRLNFFLGAIVLFFIFDLLERLLKVNLMIIFYATSVLRLIINFNVIFSTYFLISFFSQLVVFLIFVYFLINLTYFKFGVHVAIPDLKPGMNLCEKIIKKGNKYTVEPDIKISLFMFLHEKAKTNFFIENKPEGLTKSDIQKIQELNKDGKIDVGALLIQKRIPYAPFQFFGALILIILSILG